MDWTHRENGGKGEVKRIVKWAPVGRRRKGRPKERLDSIVEDIKTMDIRN